MTAIFGVPRRHFWRNFRTDPRPWTGALPCVLLPGLTGYFVSTYGITTRESAGVKYVTEWRSFTHSNKYFESVSEALDPVLDETDPHYPQIVLDSKALTSDIHPLSSKVPFSVLAVMSQCSGGGADHSGYIVHYGDKDASEDCFSLCDKTYSANNLGFHIGGSNHKDSTIAPVTALKVMMMGQDSADYGRYRIDDTWSYAGYLKAVSPVATAGVCLGANAENTSEFHCHSKLLEVALYNRYLTSEEWDRLVILYKRKYSMFL